jgi:patatin-like phospholipase/acyl hydrolase
LEATLTNFFQDIELQTALTPLLISSYDLQGQLPFFFKSHRIAADPSYNWKVTEIARATSAAPTFFPPLHLTRGNQDYALVDGGVFVNNPSIAAYAEARTLYPDAAEMVIVSVGTGDRQDQITYASAREWGLLGWAKQIVPVLMDSVSEAVDYELGCLPGCVYYRLQVPWEKLERASSDMDNVTPENLANLQSVANDYVTSIAGLLDKICAQLKEGRGSDMPGIGRTLN